jgi:hypothetical protein
LLLLRKGKGRHGGEVRGTVELVDEEEGVVVDEASVVIGIGIGIANGCILFHLLILGLNLMRLLN